ncbi:MAG: IgGFc-binding protein, partial [Calditrichia bacterium]
MKKVIPFLVIVVLLFAATISSQAQILDNKGNDFYLTFLRNIPSAAPHVELHLTSDVSTTVTVDYPINSPTFTTTVNVNPGAITIVSLPVNSSFGWTAGTVGNNGVHAYSTDEFVCYMVNRLFSSSDAAMAIPVDALGTTYIAAGYYSDLVATDRGQFAIVAPNDSTSVTITPSANLQGGYTAGVPFTILLNQGETFLAISNTAGINGDITGSIIEADKPVEVTNGNNCTTVPPGTPYCDHIFEVAQPVKTWGYRVPVVNLPNRGEGSVYRVLAQEDITSITLDGSLVATLNRGEFYETAIMPGAHYFEGDKNIYVVQYMTSSTRPLTGGIGDPAMGNMIPIGQYLSSYTFSTVGGQQFEKNYATILAENADVNAGNILLDGVVIPAANFTPIAGTSYSYSVDSLSHGTHISQSAGVHGLTVEGYNPDDSYLYPGGAGFEVPQADNMAPTCDLDAVNPGPPVSIDIRVQDMQSGIASIIVL